MRQGKIVAFVFMLIMLMVTQKLIAVYPLTRTYSISPDSLHQIRNAFNTNIPFDGITYNPLMHTGCLFNEELYLDNNFEPIWNQTTISPCIDAGMGYNDPDGTPPDIGAFRTTDHGYWTYCFRSDQNDRSDTYHWVSYPVVNSLTQGKTVARSFFHELLGTHLNTNELEEATVLQEILWYEDNQSRFIVWNGVNWGPFVDTHSVVSHQGYKVKLLPVANNELPPPHC